MRPTHRQIVKVVHLSPADGWQSFEEDRMRILSLLDAGRTRVIRRLIPEPILGIIER